MNLTDSISKVAPAMSVGRMRILLIRAAGSGPSFVTV